MFFRKRNISLLPCLLHKQKCTLFCNFQVVFLPFSASGRFYTTAHKTSKNPNHVYLMAHILKNHKLPLTVRLVCGYMPRVPCSFTGRWSLVALLVDCSFHIYWKVVSCINSFILAPS